MLVTRVAITMCLAPTHPAAKPSTVVRTRRSASGGGSCGRSGGCHSGCACGRAGSFCRCAAGRDSLQTRARQDLRQHGVISASRGWGGPRKPGGGFTQGLSLESEPLPCRVPRPRSSQHEPALPSDLPTPSEPRALGDLLSGLENAPRTQHWLRLRRQRRRCWTMRPPQRTQRHLRQWSQRWQRRRRRQRRRRSRSHASRWRRQRRRLRLRSWRQGCLCA